MHRLPASGKPYAAAICLAALAILLPGCTSHDAPRLLDPATTAAPAPTENAAWTLALQQAIPTFRRGGGYATSRTATLNLCRSASRWNAAQHAPDLRPHEASPSYCSSASYLLLLQALKNWDRGNPTPRISPRAWHHLVPRENQHDGEYPWGWANANGPGLAVLIHELGAGYSFENWERARPGDWMKIFWTDKLGKREHGHLTLLIKDGGDTVTFWSSNTPGGYGLKTVPKNRIGQVLFTRITHPENFDRAPRIGYNPWLASLLKKDVSLHEVRRKSGISSSRQH